MQRSKDLGGKLIVIVNNDIQASKKKGAPFMPAAERVKLIRSMECVDAAIEALDEDRTVCKTVRLLVPDVFTNGGDQTNVTIPEAPICQEIGCELVDGLGSKLQSSSWCVVARAVPPQSVRRLTRPLQALAEGQGRDHQGQGEPQRVRRDVFGACEWGVGKRPSPHFRESNSPLHCRPTSRFIATVRTSGIRRRFERRPSRASSFGATHTVS